MALVLELSEEFDIFSIEHALLTLHESTMLELQGVQTILTEITDLRRSLLGFTGENLATSSTPDTKTISPACFHSENPKKNLKILKSSNKTNPLKKIQSEVSNLKGIIFQLIQELVINKKSIKTHALRNTKSEKFPEKDLKPKIQHHSGSSSSRFLANPGQASGIYMLKVNFT